MKLFLRVTTALLFIAGIIWLIVDPGFDALTAFLTGILTLIGSFVVDKKTDAETVDQRNRRIMLGHVENFWVKGILEKSLHGAALLDLGIKEDPEALNYPWAIKREANKEMLPAGTSMLEIFQDIGLGRSLLILGAPGSGKTTMLLELTRQLIERAREDVTEPIPVVFNLSSWKRELSLADWLTRELNNIYAIPKKFAPIWVRENKMHLLLDGLDEVRQDSRDRCVDAINQFRKENGLTGVVVCSRIQDYAERKTRLFFDGAIEIQPLTPIQLEQYFKRFGEGLAGIRQVLEKDIVLREMAETPLFLSIMTLAYRDTQSKDILVSENLDLQRKHLFDTYIERMFERPRSKNVFIKKQYVVYWLSWLAQKMVEHNEVPYLIENMQPEWLGKNQAWWYELIQGISVLMIFSLIGGLIGRLFGGIASVLIGVLVGVIIPPSFLLIIWFVEELIPWLISRLVFRLGNVLNNRLIIRTIVGMAIGIAIGVAIGVTEMINYLIRSLVSFRQFGLINILKVPINIWILLTNMLKAGLPLALYFGIFFGLIAGFISGLSSRHGIDKILFFQRGIRKPKSILSFGKTSIEMVEALRLNWNKAGQDTVFITLIFTMIFSLIGGLFFGMCIGLSIGLFTLLSNNGLENRPIDQTTFPGQKILFSTKNSFSIFLIIVLTGGVIIISIENLIGEINFALLNAMIIGVLLVGLITGLSFGGSAIFKHYSLRFILSTNNRLPWRVIPFLDYCTDLIFLRRVGGGYIFMHRLLMEHFVSMRQDEKEPDIIASRGEAYYKMEKYDQALSDFNRAIQLDPKNPQIIISRGETFRAMEKYDQALSDFNQAIQLDPENYLAILCRGYTYNAMEKYDQALSNFNQIIQLYPANPWVIGIRGETYRMMGKYDLALSDFNQAIQLKPENGWAIISRGQIYQMTGKYDLALSDFNQIIQFDPKDTSVIISRAETLLLMEKYDLALSDFNQIIQLDPKNTLAIISRAETLLLIGKYDQCLTECDNNIKENPDLDWNYFLRAEIYKLQNNESQFRLNIKHAVDLALSKNEKEPENIPNLFNLGLYALVSEDIEQARQIYQRGNAINPTLSSLKAAVTDLENLVRLFPKFQDAQVFREMLKIELNIKLQGDH